jgi:hypothetical protein
VTFCTVEWTNEIDTTTTTTTNNNNNNKLFNLEKENKTKKIKVLVINKFVI